MNRTAARIGDLAIARFDGGVSVVCLVIGRDIHSEMIFMYSEKKGEMITGRLPKGRLQAISVKLSDHPSGRWNLSDMNFEMDPATEEVFVVHKHK